MADYEGLPPQPVTRKIIGKESKWRTKVLKQLMRGPVIPHQLKQRGIPERSSYRILLKLVAEELVFKDKEVRGRYLLKGFEKGQPSVGKQIAVKSKNLDFYLECGWSYKGNPGQNRNVVVYAGVKELPFLSESGPVSRIDPNRKTGAFLVIGGKESALPEGWGAVIRGQDNIVSHVIPPNRKPPRKS